MDEKSLIKKYQREISILKQELQQLKSGMMDKENQTAPDQEDLVNLKLQVGAYNRINTALRRKICPMIIYFICSVSAGFETSVSIFILYWLVLICDFQQHISTRLTKSKMSLFLDSQISLTNSSFILR